MADPLRIEGMDALLAKIATLQQLRMVEAGLLAGGAHMKTQMQKYPTQRAMTRASIYGSPFKSDKQRRFFFYALAKGMIQVPYRRGQSPGSRNLKQGWTVRSFNGGLSVEIGNAAPYGPLVQGQGRQSLYHKAAGWQTDEEVMDREGPAVIEYVRDEITRAISE